MNSKKYVIYNFFGIKGTPKENYDAVVRDGRKITNFSTFDSMKDIMEYVVKELHYAPENIMVIGILI